MSGEIFANEEDIRGKLLLPFLKDLDFDESEILLEKSFTVRLGKSQHTIKGRSDILCRRNNANLFIIELKRDSAAIKPQDVEQGISYARLLKGNIAPFTIISNGRETEIYDSITSEELTHKKISESSFWKSGCNMAADLDLGIRYEALKKFVSFSSANLKQFCQSQVQDRMGTIIGSIDTPYAKFIKEIYVQRKGLLAAFDNFINSGSSVFGIAGNAGVGKTSAICSLALEHLEDRFVFFYNASIINKSPLEHIAQDLNLAFSARSESDTVLKKLDELASFINKDILIFIDALDESINPHISLEMSEMSLAVRNLERVKICISCKSSIWKNILKKNDTPNHLYEELNKSHGASAGLEGYPGFLLEGFTKEELKGIIPLYKNAFNFRGTISESLLKELENGFFLRIFSEVYSHRQIPESIDDKELIHSYIKQSLEKTDLGFNKGVRILAKIGKILASHKFSSLETHNDEGLDVENLLEQLGFSIDENIPEDLFSRNILIRSNKEDSYNISFYYSKIRDYIICFHSYRLDKLSNDDFYNTLAVLYENYIGQSALQFYVENASAGQLEILIQYKKDRALDYVQGYDSYLQENFRKFKNLFDPKTQGDIGIFLPKEILREDGYALFPLHSDSSNQLQLENLGFSENLDHNIFYRRGVQSVHGSNIPLMIRDQNEIIRKNIFKQLKEMVYKGYLNAYNSEMLLVEELSVILYHYSKKLNYSFNIKDYYLPRYESLYPIDLRELRARILRFRATEYYGRKQTDPDLLHILVDKAVNEDIAIPKLNISGDFPPFEELFKIVEILLKKGCTEIKEHYLPAPDKSIAETQNFYEQNRSMHIPEIRTVQYSAEQAKLYIETFFKNLDICYKDFAEYFFPGFTDQFDFYNSMPHEYFFFMQEGNIRKRGLFGFRTSQDGKSKVNFENFKPPQKVFESNIGIKTLYTFEFDDILKIDEPVKTVQRINSSKVDEFCILRNWIYKFLKEDMDPLFKKHKE